MKPYLLIIILSALLCYVLGAFINAGFDITKWTEANRGVCIVCYCFLIIIAFITYNQRDVFKP